MSQSVIISGISKATAEEQKKLQIIKNCEELGINVPEELEGFKAEGRLPLAYFADGVLKIDESDVCEKWQHPEHEDIHGVEIIVDSLPQNVSRVRIVFE